MFFYLGLKYEAFVVLSRARMRRDGDGACVVESEDGCDVDFVPYLLPVLPFAIASRIDCGADFQAVLTRPRRREKDWRVRTILLSMLLSMLLLLLLLWILKDWEISCRLFRRLGVVARLVLTLRRRLCTTGPHTTRAASLAPVAPRVAVRREWAWSTCCR